MTEHDTFLAEYSTWVDSVHRSTPGSESPPADLWQRILAQANPPQKESEQMSVVTTAPKPMPTLIPIYSRTRGGLGHYLNLAATIALVLAVAVAGWFATSQLNEPGNQEPRHGMLSATPGAEVISANTSATCDVEPMTVDEVLTVIQNPYGVDNPDPDPEYFRQEQLRRVMLVTDVPLMPHNFVDQELIDSLQKTPDEGSFSIAVERMNGFLACAQNGTVGQVAWFIRPFELQRIVTAELSLFRDEATVRHVLEELLPMPGSILMALSESAFVASDYVFSANTNIEQAASPNTSISFRYAASDVIMIGLTVTDQSGEVVFQSDASGRANPAGPLLTTDRFRVIMVESVIDEQWYVLAVIPE